METKKKEQNTKAEAETFAATVKGMNRDDQLRRYEHGKHCINESRPGGFPNHPHLGGSRPGDSRGTRRPRPDSL